MFLLRFAKNDQDTEYATTVQTLTEANKCINNITNTLRKCGGLESMKKQGNNYYVYRLANSNSLYVYVSKPTEVWYQLQFLDDDEKIIRAYKLQNVDKASQLIFKNRGLEYKLFIVADNESIEYTDPESPDFIGFVEEESENEDEDSYTETKPNAVDEYGWALQVAVLIAGVLSIVTLVSASGNGGYISPSAYWLLVAALVIAIAITRTKLKSINTHTFCHVALGVPVFFAIATIILGTMIRLASLNSTESTGESTSLTIATNLEGASDYTETGTVLGAATQGLLLVLLYRIATTDYGKRK